MNNEITIAAVALIIILSLIVWNRRIVSEKNDALYRLMRKQFILEKKYEEEQIKNKILSEIVSQKISTNSG